MLLVPLFNCNGIQLACCIIGQQLIAKGSIAQGLISLNNGHFIGVNQPVAQIYMPETIISCRFLPCASAPIGWYGVVSYYLKCKYQQNTMVICNAQWVCRSIEYKNLTLGAIDHCVLIHLGAQWHSRYLWNCSAARNEVNHRLVVQV